MMKLRKITLILSLVWLVVACDEYLSVKPDQSLAVPNIVEHLQALLDNETYFNQNYPQAGDVASDYYYLDEADWESLSLEYDRQNYVWDGQTDIINDWNLSYQSIFMANVVLDEIESASLDQSSELDRDRVWGGAYFFRGWRHFLLAQLFAPHYRPGVNDDELGLPLRTDSDISITSVRSSLVDTYQLIMDDLTMAARLLPDGAAIPTRPSKASAFAALARVNLVIGNWDAAYRYADSSLQLHAKLIDYSTIDYEGVRPFEQFNDEVLLHTTVFSSSGVFVPSRARVDSVLYHHYTSDDLRKEAYYFANLGATFSFKGGYSGEGNSARSAMLFSGLATDEMYLTKAEALARMGNEQEAIMTLNVLLVNRYDSTWQPYRLEDLDTDILAVILNERERSLAFRAGIRWSDLRRLNTDERFSRTLIRHLGDQTFVLPPNDRRYTFLIPSEIIQLTGMKQNVR